MRLKDFLYFGLDETGKPLVGNLNTHKVETASPTTLLDDRGDPAFMKKTPDGWKDVLVKYGRNTKYKGLFREFTVQMRFVRDGALILRWLFWKYGIEAYLKLLILKNDRTEWPEKHKTWYAGEIDFSKFKQDKNGIVTTNVMEGGLSKYLKAFENTTYEIPIGDDFKHLNLINDGVTLNQKTSWLITPASGASKSFVPVQFISSEGKAAGFAAHSVFARNYGVINADTLDYFAQTTQAITGFHLTGEIKFKTIINNGTYILELVFYNEVTGAIRKVNILTEEVLAFTEYTFPIDVTFDTEGYERIFLATGENSPIVSYGESTIKLEFDSRYRPTLMKGLSPFRLCEKIVEKMTNGKYKVKSDFLTSLDDVFITSGDAIRGLEGAVIKTSLTNFFKWASRYGVGLAIENDMLVIEKDAYFFKSTVGFDLGEVNDIEFTPAEDIMFNTIKVGYTDQEYELVNGKSEFNVTQQWTTPITKIIKELDLVSPYRADCYGIEDIRINFDQKDTTDSKSDNDTFVINVTKPVNSIITNVGFVASGNFITLNNNVNILAGQRIKITGSNLNDGEYDVLGVGSILVAKIAVLSGTLQDEDSISVQVEYLSGGIQSIYRPAYSTLEGVNEPESIYNVEFSPKRSLIANGQWIRSILDKQDAGKIVFQSSEKNRELLTVLSGVTVDEDLDITIANLGAKLFLPYYFNFQTSVPFNFQQLMRDHPYERITFTWKGKQFSGFMWDGGIKPATNDKQQWKLICAPDVNTNKFI